MIQDIRKVRFAITQFLRNHWIDAMLWISLLWVVLVNLGDTYWVKETLVLQLNFIPAIILSLMLAISKFRFPFALLFLQIFSMTAAIQSAFRILPQLSEFPENTLFDFLQIANARSFAFGSRVRFLLAHIPGQFLLLPEDFKLAILVWIAWFCVFFLFWMLKKRGNVLAGIIPFGVLIGLNIYFNHSQAQFLVAYIGIGCLLHALINAKGLLSRWKKRGIDYSEDLGLEWGTVTVVLVVLIVSATSGAVYLRDFDWQAYQERRSTAEQSDISSEKENQAISSDEPEQVRITQDLVLSFSPPPSDNRIVFQARIIDPENKLNTSNRRVNYWRQQYYHLFDGQRWEEEELLNGLGEGVQTELMLMDSVTQRIEYFGLFTYGVALGIPINVGYGYELAHDASGNTIIVKSTEEYVNSTLVYSIIPELDLTLLSTQGFDFSDGLKDNLLLPESVTERTIRLTEKVIDGAETEFQKALLIEDFLRTSYPYSLEVLPPPEGQDAVDYFLFDAPGGFCSYYATAMSIMLRIADVPSRVVTGFQLGHFELESGYYQVSASDAHAWVEGYFPGVGWVEFEPTGAFPVAGMALAAEEQTSGVQQQTIGFDFGNWLRLMAVITGAFLVVLLVLFAKFRVIGKRTLEEVYLNYRHLLNRLNTKFHLNDTPLEFQNHFSIKHVNLPKTKEALNYLTCLYNQDQYSRHKASKGDFQLAKIHVRRSYIEIAFHYIHLKIHKNNK
jgi:hypothetical protein